jgi:tetratricopeptide (TPR) repeat protein
MLSADEAEAAIADGRRLRAAGDRIASLKAFKVAAQFGLGHTFRHLRERDSADWAFRRVLELEPTHCGANIGYTLKSLSRREEALLASQAAATANPANTSLKVEVANLLRELGRADEAIATLRAAVDQEPCNATQLASLGRLLKQTGRTAERECNLSHFPLSH